MYIRVRLQSGEDVLRTVRHYRGWASMGSPYDPDKLDLVPSLISRGGSDVNEWDLQHKLAVPLEYLNASHSSSARRLIFLPQDYSYRCNRIPATMRSIALHAGPVSRSVAGCADHRNLKLRKCQSRPDLLVAAATCAALAILLSSFGNPPT